MVAAEKFEFDGVLRRTTGVRQLGWPMRFAAEGTLNGRRVVFVANGPGPRLAAEALETVLRAMPVDQVVSTGTCGGLDPALRVGDVVEAGEVLDSVSGEKFATVSNAGSTIVSQNRVAVTAAEKRTLRGTGASAVEMEAAGVARSAAAHTLPFFCIRAVSDDADAGLPLDFNCYRDDAGRFDRSAIAKAAVMRPFSRIPALIRLHRNAGIASEKLGEYLASRF
ncbi:MAG: hypothetical protein HYZ37_02970 [Candidatus Solibacter usitatus]|nr:hypothetical protein [Candidatus Solibacter usitatus]